MQLWHASTSPFARKAVIAMRELNLAGVIQLVEVNPWTDQRLRRLNPLSKVPTLVRPDGPPLIESAVICEYFDALATEGRLFRLFPAAGEARWRALRLQALADGVANAATRLHADERRAPFERSQVMMARFREGIEAGLSELEREAAGLAGEAPTIGEIAIAAATGYLEFRWPDRDWLAARPGLAAWFTPFRRRGSMTASEYRLPVQVQPH